MQCLDDKKYGVFWYWADKSKETKEMSSELDAWKSEAIDKFIIPNKEMKLGVFTTCVQDFNSNKRFFGYIDGELVAVVIMRSSDILREKYLMLSHLMTTEWGSLKDAKNILSYQKAKKIIYYNNDKNNDYIQYLIVSPRRQGRGYGTRVVGSIKNNLEFFASGSSHNSLSTQINSANIASQKVFERNNFKTLIAEQDICRSLDAYFLEDDFMEK